jgi:hypothetical protein
MKRFGGNPEEIRVKGFVALLLFAMTGSVFTRSLPNHQVQELKVGLERDFTVAANTFEIPARVTDRAARRHHLSY